MAANFCDMIDVTDEKESFIVYNFCYPSTETQKKYLHFPLCLLYVKILDQTPISDQCLCSFLLLSHLKQQAEHHTDQQVKRN